GARGARGRDADRGATARSGLLRGQLHHHHLQRRGRCRDPHERRAHGALPGRRHHRAGRAARAAVQAERAALQRARRARPALARRRRGVPLRRRAAGARGVRARPRGTHDHRVPARAARALAGTHRQGGQDRRGQPLAAGPRHGVQQPVARAGAAPRRNGALRLARAAQAMKRLAFLLLVLAGPALAEKADRDKPTQVEANKMSADDARRLNIFEGEVVVTKGTIRLTAEKLIVRQDAEGFQLATATGKPAKFRQRQDAKPGEKEGIWVEGEALRIELDDKNQKIELFDKARVNRGGDEVAGDYIFVDQRADFYQVSSGKGGEKHGRVKAVIQSKPPAGAPAAK